MWFSRFWIAGFIWTVSPKSRSRTLLKFRDQVGRRCCGLNRTIDTPNPGSRSGHWREKQYVMTTRRYTRVTSAARFLRGLTGLGEPGHPATVNHVWAVWNGLKSHGWNSVNMP